MKTLEQYLSLHYPIEIIPDEGGFIALLPDLPGCMSSGSTVHEAVEGLAETKELWLAGRLEKHLPIPEPTTIEDYSGKFVLRLPRSLHRSLDFAARNQGVSLNQYLVHLLSERNAATAVGHALEIVFTQIVEASSRAERPDPAWCWSVDAVLEKACVSPSTNDLVAMLHEMRPASRRHTIVASKQLHGKKEACN